MNYDTKQKIINSAKEIGNKYLNNMLDSKYQGQSFRGSRYPVEYAREHRDMRERVMCNSRAEKPALFAEARWLDASNDWYKSGEIIIKNLSNADIDNPTISFKLDKGHYMNHWGLQPTPIPQVDNKYTACLVQEKQIIEAGGSVAVTFGISYTTSVTIGQLPYDFEIGGESIEFPPTVIPPSAPTGLEYSNLGPTSVDLKWIPSTSLESLVVRYSIRYCNELGYETVVYSDINTYTLYGLEPNMNYEIRVQAIDMSGNISEFSAKLTIMTPYPLEGPKQWSSAGAIFVDATAYPTPIFAEYNRNTNVQNYIAGFVVGLKKDGIVKATWGGNDTMYDSYTQQTYSGDVTVSDYKKGDFNNIVQNGGKVYLSFGGASNEPFEGSITNIDELVNIYEKIIKNYNMISGLDFDFEGAFIANTPALARHISAITRIIKHYPHMEISYTLPVDGSPGSLVGFNHNGDAFLHELHKSGINPSLINGMAMELSNPPTMLEGTVQCALGMHNTIKQIWRDTWNEEEVWGRIGICPMFGRNNNGKIFNLDDFSEFIAWSEDLDHPVRCINGWDLVRDSTGCSMTGIVQTPGDFGRIISKFRYPLSLNTVSRSLQAILDRNVSVENKRRLAGYVRNVRNVLKE